MDRAQIFIRDYLLTRGGNDAQKLEDRLTQNLIIAATQTRKTKPKKKTKPLLFGEGSGVNNSIKQTGYKRVTRNSKKILRNYILSSKNAAEVAHKIIKKKEAQGDIKALTKIEKYEYIKKNYPDIYKELPQRFDQVDESLYKKMWLPYIREVLKISDSQSLQSINMQNSLLKLSIADYNGCMLRVSKTANTTVSDMEGIVLWDAQKSFIMLVAQQNSFDTLKVIPKKGSIFEISVPLVNSADSVIFSIVGDRFQYRASDRSGKKFKNKRVDDLVFYLSKESSNAST